MERIARFEKVSRERYIKDYIREFGTDEELKDYTEYLECPAGGSEGADIGSADAEGGCPEIADKASALYDAITLPGRATTGSAGYDICTPMDIELKPGMSIKIPTGIRVSMRDDYCMFIMPRSGLGSKFRFQLNNTVGVIDSDYYYSDNEGHIFVPMINDSRDGKTVELKAGNAFVQAIFMSYGITVDDDAEGSRNGGFGSTG